MAPVAGGALPDPEDLQQAHVRLMAAYRATLRAGDRLPMWCQGVLLHVVALSSRRAAMLLLTRVDGARPLATETSEFAAALSGVDLAGGLLQRMWSFLLKPVSNWKNRAMSAGVAVLTAYFVTERLNWSGAWVLATLAFAAFSFTLAWLGARLAWGRPVVVSLLAHHLDDAENGFYALFGMRPCARGTVACCPPPRRSLLGWGVRTGIVLTTLGVAASWALWGLFLAYHHTRPFYIAADVVLALLPLAVVAAGRVLAASPDPMLDTLHALRRRHDTVLLTTATPATTEP